MAVNSFEALLNRQMVCAPDTREELLKLGATPHRGPLAVDPGRSICQLLDPFGNIFGLDGPS